MRRGSVLGPDHTERADQSAETVTLILSHLPTTEAASPAPAPEAEQGATSTGAEGSEGGAAEAPGPFVPRLMLPLSLPLSLLLPDLTARCAADSDPEG